MIESGKVLIVVAVTCSISDINQYLQAISVISGIAYTFYKLKKDLKNGNK